MKANRQAAVIFFLTFLFALLYGLLSVQRHLRFDSFAYDLGIYDQAIWQYSRLEIPFNTIKEKLILADHFTPSLALLAPLFWLWDDVKMLLIFQAFWLAASGWPVFLLARAKRISFWLSVVVVGIYLAFFGFQHALNFDFHEVVIAAGLAPWLIYFWQKRAWKRFLLAAVLFAGLKENLALMLVCLGMISFWRGQKKIGLLLASGALFYFLATVKLLIPLLSPNGYEYLPQLPANLPQAVTALFWPKVKLETWFYALGWFSFLPLLAPVTLLPIVVDLAQHFLAGEKYAGTWGLFMHYRASLGPFLAWGAIEGLARLPQKIKPVFLLPLPLLLPLFFQYALHLPLNRLAKSYFWQNEVYMEDNQKIIAAVPATASVVAQNSLVPHLSHRQEIYLLWPRQIDGRWRLFWAGEPEYLVVDLHAGQAITHLLAPSEVELKQAVENEEREGVLVLTKAMGESRLYKIIKK